MLKLSKMMTGGEVDWKIGSQVLKSQVNQVTADDNNKEEECEIYLNGESQRRGDSDKRAG